MHRLTQHKPVGQGLLGLSRINTNLGGPSNSSNDQSPADGNLSQVAYGPDAFFGKGSHVGGGTRHLLCSADMITFGYCIGSLSSGVKIHMLRRNLRNTRVAVFEQAYI